MMETSSHLWQLLKDRGMFKKHKCHQKVDFSQLLEAIIYLTNTIDNVFK